MTREQLIAALERAEGPSLELDLAIKKACGVPHNPKYLALQYTSSLDAALTLVPDSTEAVRCGATVSAYPNGRGEARIWCQVRDDGAEGGWAIGVVPGNPGLPANIGATPAIALCVAALKARA